LPAAPLGVRSQGADEPVPLVALTLFPVIRVLLIVATPSISIPPGPAPGTPVGERGTVTPAIALAWLLLTVLSRRTSEPSSSMPPE